MANNIIKNIMILFGGNIIQKIIGFAALGYYARIFGAEELALIPIYYLITNLAFVLFGFGFQAYIMKTLPGLLFVDKEKAAILINKILSVMSFSGLIFSASFFIIFNYLYQLDQISVLSVIGIAGFAIGTGFECLNATQLEIITASKKFKQLATLGIIKTILLPALILPLYYLMGADGIAISMGALSLVSYLITQSVIRDLRKIGSANESLTFKSLISETWPFYMESGLMMLRRQGDQLAVLVFMGSDSLGIYYIAMRLGEMIWSLATMADSVIAPELSRQASASFVSLKKTFETLVKVGLYIAIPIGLVSSCLVPVYVQLVSGNKYVAATAPAVLLCLKIISELQRVTIIGRTALAVCKPISRLIMTILDVVVLVPIAIIGAKHDSLVWVASAPIFSSMVSGYFGVYLLKRKIDIEFPIYEMIKLASTLLLALLLAYSMHILIGTSLWKSIFITIISLAIYLLTFINIVNIEAYNSVANMLPKPIQILAYLMLKLKLSGRKIQ